MARRRMIDPNFWQSEDVSKLTIRQRLLLIGLFSNADDEGRLRGTPAYVRSAVFPYEDFSLSDIQQDLNAIESIGSIRQYTVESSKYIFLVNWFKFQRVDKPQGSVIPTPPINEEIHSNNDSNNDSCLKEEKRREVKGKEEKGIEMPAPDSNPHKDRILALINQCDLKEITLYELDILYSYIGVCDVEIIEACIKKGQGKHVNYAVKTLKGKVKEGITKKSQLNPIEVGDNVVQFEGIRQGFTNEHDRPFEEQPEWQPPAKYRETARLPDVSGH